MITLRSGPVLSYAVDREIRVSLGAEVVHLLYPQAGYGGGELVVSPDERHGIRRPREADVHPRRPAQPVPPVTPVGMGKATRGVEPRTLKDLDEKQVVA